MTLDWTTINLLNKRVLKAEKRVKFLENLLLRSANTEGITTDALEMLIVEVEKIEKRRTKIKMCKNK